MSTGHSRLGLVIRVGSGVAGAIFMAIAFRETWDRSQGQAIPGWWFLVAAELLTIVGLAGGSRGWVCLFEGQGSARVLTEAFYSAQVGKYVPGAIWQAVGQVALSRRGGVSLTQATTTFPVHALTQAAAGGTVGAMLAVVGFHLPTGVRVAAFLGLALVLPLRRTWMVWVLASLPRQLKRVDAGSLPSQGAILRSYAWGIWTLVFSGTAFALLVYPLDAASPPAAAVPAFALAWTVGYLAVPFPAGIGIREAVLVVAASSPAGPAPVIVASIFHRLVTMVGELVMILVTKSRATMSR